MNKGAKRFAFSALIAAAAGYLAGILTAPKSGRETRGDIKQAASTSVTEAEKQLKKLHTELNQLLAATQSKGADAKGRAKEELDGLVSKSTAAKQKARELLSAVHEGDADDKDLKRAITEASKAVSHLRSYLTK